MTACVIFSPSFASASARSFDKIIAEISGGENVLSWPFTSTCTCASPLAAFDDFVRDAFLFFERPRRTCGP